MEFKTTSLEGAFIIYPEKKEDIRGHFSRCFCKSTFEKKGLVDEFVQYNLSFNQHKNTLRGLHYQLMPFSEVKLVRCTKGSLWDVILDLRPSSSTFGKWFGVTLTADTPTLFYIPQGCAHGYITLCDETEIFYFSSSTYQPDYERSVRWDDPMFQIQWPASPAIISEKDKNVLDFNPLTHLEPII